MTSQLFSVSINASLLFLSFFYLPKKANEKVTRQLGSADET